MARTQRRGQGGRQSGSHFAGADERSGQAFELPRGVEKKTKKSKEKLIGLPTPAGLGEERTVGSAYWEQKRPRGAKKKMACWYVLALAGFACMEKQAT